MAGGKERSDRRNWEIGMTHKTLLSATVPRWVDKKSGIPEEGKRVWGSQGRGKDKLFFSTFLNVSPIKRFFSSSLELMITQQTTQFKLCTRDYTTALYPS